MRQVILGSDWWTDCDDVMAVRILCNLHKQGVFKLLGVVLNACMDKSVRSLAGFLAWHGVSVPLGLDTEAVDFGGTPPYQARLAELPSVFQDNAGAENPVALYRRLLAGCSGKVTLLEIGYPQVLADLLQSPPDGYSALSGVELVREKVEHLWMMAGKWDDDPGRENNFARNRRSARGGHAVCSMWPTEITFLGFEVGFDVISGACLPDGDPLTGAMLDHGSGNGRSSWDPMLILLAAAVSPEAAGYKCVYGRAAVDPESGYNSFVPMENGPHRFVVKLQDNSFYQQAVDSMLKPGAVRCTC